WRRVGVDGCVRLEGCVNLISSGTDGFLVGLLGSAEEGRDVFFTSHSQLVSGDNDSAGDIYDARIGGGFPAVARPPECEGDACSTPVSPPNDPTPSSFTFNGQGNAPPVAKPKPKAKPRKCVKRAHVKCVASKK